MVEPLLIRNGLQVGYIPLGRCECPRINLGLKRVFHRSSIPWEVFSGGPIPENALAQTGREGLPVRRGPFLWAREGHALTAKGLTDQFGHGQPLGGRGLADQLPLIGRRPKGERLDPSLTWGC
jgi:hypothetical protein